MTKITRERVKDILEFGSGRIISPITDDEIMELARIALAALTAEPAKCGHVNLDCDDGKAVCLNCGKTWEV